MRYLAGMLVVACAFAFAGDIKNIDLTISGMHCSNCTEKVKSAIEKVGDVKDVQVSLKNGTAKVVLASTSTADAGVLAQAVADAGFGASYKEGKETKTIAAAKTDHDDKDCEGTMGSEDCKKDGMDCCKGKTMKSKEVKKK